jgi:uncharacterized protein (TIGR03790 family)
MLPLAAAAVLCLDAQTGANVLLVVNGNDAQSREIGQYYRPRRSVPVKNVCTIATTSEETIDWPTYERQIERPVGDCLRNNGLAEQVLYIVTTLGVPLRVEGAGAGMASERCSVDSELALLYAKLKGVPYQRPGGVPNPYFGQRDAPFRHPRFPLYMVTRLAAYDAAEVRGMIDRSLAARNRGRFVIDLNGPGSHQGNNWLRTAVMLLPAARVTMDETVNVVYGQKEVIGYASWGSNDDHRDRRWLGFEWLPGAIATEFVSSNGRTFKRPPDGWMFRGANSSSFGGSSQSLSADYIHEGATGASGNVFEPYLSACARPDYLLPAYSSGRNLAESYYMSLQFLSWMGIVLGDPLCALV